MNKVHIVKWLVNGRIDSVYADYGKACRVAEGGNKKRKWVHYLFPDTRWVVETFVII